MATDGIKLTIDGRRIIARPGDTVRRAASRAAIEIPGICDHEKLLPIGACRVCVVEIENVRGFPTACTTPVSEGMVVRTQSDELRLLRNRVLELMMSGHPNACLVCDYRENCEKHKPFPAKAGRSTRCGLCSNRPSCELRTLALSSNTRELALPTIYSVQKLVRDEPFVDRDLNLCILCARCWRICESIHGKPVLSIVQRGKEARIGTAFDKSWVDSGCTFCGACVDICPTGTLTDRYARWHGNPHDEWLSTCTICPEGCTLYQRVVDRKLLATRMQELDHDSRLCAVGRFGFAQLVNAAHRLDRPMIRESGELVPVEWSEAISVAAKRLQEFKNPGEAVILTSEADIRETNLAYEMLAHFLNGCVVKLPAGAGRDSHALETLKAGISSGKIRAAVLTGDYLEEETLAQLRLIIVADFVLSAAVERADVVLPAAILSEVTGTFRTSRGEVKSLGPTSAVHGEARAEWKIARDLAKAMGADGFDWDYVFQVTDSIQLDPAPSQAAGSPRDRLADLPVRFRGHNLADHVPALASMGLPHKPPVASTNGSAGFRIIRKEEIVPNFHLITVEAPAIAQHAKPGQFLIVMVHETSERVPFTLADWDAAAGTVTFVVEEVGRSSREVVSLKQGDFIAHLSGPLGVPLPIENVGTVALAGGCYGIGAIYPLARAFKQAGNSVLCILEASSHFLFYMDDKLKAVCDELVYTTRDGSRGFKGGVHDILVDRLKGDQKPNFMVAIGCTFMMRLTEEATRPFAVPLYVALNPIMVDGTGMCGACRLSVGNETKFACVDGPFFDAHKVDWDELRARRMAYTGAEVEALPQEPAPRIRHPAS